MPGFNEKRPISYEIVEFLGTLLRQISPLIMARQSESQGSKR
jgi:hypothetical protein